MHGHLNVKFVNILRITLYNQGVRYVTFSLVFENKDILQALYRGVSCVCCHFPVTRIISFIAAMYRTMNLNTSMSAQWNFLAMEQLVTHN